MLQDTVHCTSRYHKLNGHQGACGSQKNEIYLAMLVFLKVPLVAPLCLQLLSASPVKESGGVLRASPFAIKLALSVTTVSEVVPHCSYNLNFADNNGFDIFFQDFKYGTMMLISRKAQK